jgi:nucleoside-diphosphate-sugar epimerase
MTRVCVVGVSGKLGRSMARHALDRGWKVVGVCRPGSLGKLAAFAGRITIIPGATDDRDVIARAVDAANRTRRTDFALFMVAAVEDAALVREAPAISARAAAAG